MASQPSRNEEVVRIAVVAGPAELEGAVAILLLAALAILGPFVADDLGLDADLGVVGLDQFGHALGVRVVRTR